MTFEIYRTSMKEVNYPGVNKNDGKYLIEINSLDDLDNLERHFGENLIISMKYKTIEIYDGYRE